MARHPIRINRYFTPTVRVLAATLSVVLLATGQAVSQPPRHQDTTLPDSPAIGIDVAAIDDEIKAAWRGDKMPPLPEVGLFVTKVLRHSPAARAGIKPNDVIVVRSDGNALVTAEQFSDWVTALKVGRRYSVKVHRPLANKQGRMIWKSIGVSIEPITRAKEQWNLLFEPVRQGDVEFRVNGVLRSQVPMRDLLGDLTVSKDELLLIVIQVRNLSQTKKLEYRSWMGEDFAFERDFATLQDNFGNHYKRITFGIGTKVVGQAESDSFYPGKSVSDILVFELPINTAEYLDLELPAKNFGGEGMVRLRIYANMIKHP